MQVKMSCPFQGSFESLHFSMESNTFTSNIFPLRHYIIAFWAQFSIMCLLDVNTFWTFSNRSFGCFGSFACMTLFRSILVATNFHLIAVLCDVMVISIEYLCDGTPPPPPPLPPSQLLASAYFYGDGRVDGKCCSIIHKSNKIQLKWNEMRVSHGVHYVPRSVWVCVNVNE